MKRKIKTDPALAIQLNTVSLFPLITKGELGTSHRKTKEDEGQHDEEDLIVTGDVVSDLWRF